MATHVYVVDSAFKRTQIKVTPAKFLREILEEACKLRKVDPESYTLKTQNNKAIDLSQQFRLSGLSAGAKLQLIQASRSTGVVNVALQLPDSEGGGRISDKFPSTTSLWLVLRKYEDAVAGQAQRKLNLTQRAVPSTQSSGSGRLEYEQPIVNVLGRNLETFADLQKTLSQLGVNSGSVLVRLSFQSKGRPLDEAMQEVGQHFAALDNIAAIDVESVEERTTQGTEDVHATTAGTLSSGSGVVIETATASAEGNPGSEPAKSSHQDMSIDDDPTTQMVTDDVLASSSQPVTANVMDSTSNVVNGITVYRPPSSSTPAAALAPDDPTVFEPSIEDAKAHQASLLRATRNTRLLSDKELEEQEQARQAKLALVQEVTVRVRYPDQSMIETTIKASDTPAHLYGTVMGTLAAAPEPFDLRYTGAKGHQTLPNSSSQRLVQDFGFRGKVLVTLTWSPEASPQARQGPSLKEEFRSRAKDLKVELQTQQAAGEESHRAAMAKKDPPVPGSAGQGKGGDLESKMKKFLGFKKK